VNRPCLGCCKAFCRRIAVRTAYFLADLKTDKNWVEVHDDTLEPEDMTVGRWVDVGPFKIFDTLDELSRRPPPARNAWKDPQAKEDFVIRSYKIDANVTSGAELNAAAHLELDPRLAGQSVLIFALDANLRLESVKDSSNNALAFYQSRETKDRKPVLRRLRGRNSFSATCGRNAPIARFSLWRETRHSQSRFGKLLLRKLRLVSREVRTVFRLEQTLT